jgi:uncharacterized protein (DUF1684 family)
VGESSLGTLLVWEQEFQDKEYYAGRRRVHYTDMTSRAGCVEVSRFLDIDTFPVPLGGRIHVLDFP